MDARTSSPGRRLVQLLSLWGADVAFASLCWGVLIAAHLRMTMLTAGPMLVLAATVWLVVVGGRLVAAMHSGAVGRVACYRSHLVPMVPFWLAVFSASLWMLCYHVGQSFFSYAVLPLLCLGAAGCPLLRRVREFSLLCLALAFAMGCAAPAYYYSFSLSPLHVLTSQPILLMAAVFFLFFTVRRREAPAEGAVGLVMTLCLAVLFLVCVYGACCEPAYMRGFYLALCMAVAALHVLLRLRLRLPEADWYGVGWWLMALPALPGICVYCVGV